MNCFHWILKLRIRKSTIIVIVFWNSRNKRFLLGRLMKVLYISFNLCLSRSILPIWFKYLSQTCIKVNYRYSNLIKIFDLFLFLNNSLAFLFNTILFVSHPIHCIFYPTNLLPLLFNRSMYLPLTSSFFVHYLFNALLKDPIQLKYDLVMS